MSRGRTIIRGVFALLICGVAWFGYVICRHVAVTVPNAYAVWNTADHIGDYMEAHDGQWPKSWEDLRKHYLGTDKQYSEDHWDDLRARVEIDWKADPRSLITAQLPQDGKPPFRVIWLKNGTETHWSGHEPNREVWYRLHYPREKPGTQPASSRTS